MKPTRFRHPARIFLFRGVSPGRSSLSRFPFLLLVMLMASLLAGPVGVAWADVIITVDAAQIKGEINARVFGQNVFADGNTMWDHTKDTLRSDPDDSNVNVKASIDALAPTMLRFPGGSVSDLHIWEDGLGFQTTEPVNDYSTAMVLDESPQSWLVGKGLLIDPNSGQMAFENLKGQLGDRFDFTGIDAVNHTLTGVSNLNMGHPAGAGVRPGGRPLAATGQISEGYWTNTFGIIEHLKLSNSLGAQPLLTVNYGTGLDSAGSISTEVSLEQRIMRAQALVAYCNGTTDDTPLGIDGEGRDWRTVGYWAGKRGVDALGCLKPPFGVKYWEVGNELCFESEAGCTTALDYADKFKRFAQKLKEVDPTISVGAVGLNLPTWHGDAPGDTDPWNETVIKSAKDDLDFLVIHSYYPAVYSPMDYSSDAWFKLVMAGATQAWKDLLEIRGIIDVNAPGKNIGLAVTEYGFYIPGGEPKHHSSLAGALYHADLILHLIKGATRLQLYGAAAWDLHSGNNGAAIRYQWPSIYTNSGSRVIRPQYYALKMLRQSLTRRQQVQTEVLSSPTFAIDERVGNIQKNLAVPCLEALGALSHNGRLLTLVVINRSLDSFPNATITATIQLNHLLYTPKSATVTKLTSANPGDHNEEGAVVRPSSLMYAPVPQSFSFEPHSLTIIEFRPVSVSPSINLLINSDN